MAWTICKKCKEKIIPIPEDRKCPKCGEKIPSDTLAGCLIIILAIAGFIIYGYFSSSSDPIPTKPQWLNGGTLHKSTSQQWYNSTAENRLATSADFIINLSDPKNHGMFFKDDCKLLRQFATAMEKCISEGNKKDGKLIYEKATVNEFAVNCWIIMGQQLPK